MIGGAEAGTQCSELLLIEGGSGSSGALGRKVSALASRKALCKEVSLMNLGTISRGLGPNY